MHISISISDATWPLKQIQQYFHLYFIARVYAFQTHVFNTISIFESLTQEIVSRLLEDPV